MLLKKSTTFSPYLRNIYLNKHINSPKIMTGLTTYVPLGLDYWLMSSSIRAPKSTKTPDFSSAMLEIY